MKKIIKRSAASLLSVLLTVTAMPAFSSTLRTETVSAESSKILAFPGAVGGGKYATGGRGGEVYHVTNLNDSGAGSLRDAVSKPNRIVVFDVSGTITLKSNIVCSGNITIAGQTAPGGSGITLKDYKFGMGGDNIIVRYLSSRPGPDKATSSGNDAWGGAKGSNSVIDHCSIGWTTDEQWGIYSNNDHYTVQYSVIGPANSWGGHVKGVHGFGLMMGRSNLTFDHNLICHNVSRNFRGKVVGTETADFTNNIIYDWGYQTAYGTIGHVNYVNNTLKAGNSTAGGYHYVQVSSSDNFKLYLTGNRILNKDNSYRNREDNNWSAIQYKHSDKNRSNTESTTPFTIMWNGENISTATTCESAADSYEHVIQFAGNGISSDKRTKIDKQCADETKNGTGSCSGTDAYSSSQSELSKYKIQCGVKYEYPSAVTKKEIVDKDNDGMDDNWELARGLDPNNPNDYKGDYCGQGYMNIEYYINDLTVDSFPEGVVELSPEDKYSKKGAAIDTTHKYTITNVNSGLEITAAEEKNGGNVQQGGRGANGWILTDAGNGYYYLCSEMGDGKTYYLSLENKGTANGTNISVSTDNRNDAQKFKFVLNKTGTYTITTQATDDDSCLGVASGSKDSGANILQWERNDSADQCWKIAIKVDPLQGRLIENLIVMDMDNYLNWKLTDDAKTGSLVYGDRDVTYSELPDFLTGAEIVQTACDSKNSDKDLAVFTAAKDMTVCVALDSRVTVVPTWLMQWGTSYALVTNSNNVEYKLYCKSVAKGEKIILGTNGQSTGCVNYTVFATDKSVPEITENADLNGVLFKNLTVLDTEHYAGWKVAKGLKIGDLVFGDRDVTYTAIPDILSGAEYLITACDSKLSVTDIAAFKAGADMTVYVVMDNRVTTAPAWLSDWTKTDMTAESSNGVSYVLYSKEAASGTLVTLGTNGQSSGCVGYTVFGVRSGSTIKGDINNDGKMDIADAVLLQKWLFTVPGTELQNREAADLCEDGVLNVFDLCLMKRLLLEG